MADTLIADEGFEIREKRKRRKPLSKDTNAETFWADIDAIINITKLNALNPKWGAEKISKEQTIYSEKKVKRILELYFFGNDVEKVFRKSQCNEVPHRPCVTKEKLVKLVGDKHVLNHRKADTIYENLRRSYFQVVRESINLIFRTGVIIKNTKLGHPYITGVTVSFFSRQFFPRGKNRLAHFYPGEETD